MKKLKFSALMMGISATSLAAVAAGVAVGVSQSTSHTSEVAGPVNPVTAPDNINPLTAGRYVYITFKALPGEVGITFVGNTRSKILQGSPFGTALAPKVTKEGCHFGGWTKTVEGEEVLVNAMDIVDAALEVHPKMIPDTTAIHIEGLDKQYWTFNYNARVGASPVTPVTDGTGVLDYHVYDANNTEITGADVEWEVVTTGGEDASEYATMTPSATAGETWATFNSLPKVDTLESNVMDFVIKATVNVDGTELVAEKTVHLRAPNYIGYQDSVLGDSVERPLPPELTNAFDDPTTPGSASQLVWFPYTTGTPGTDLAFNGWVALDMNSAYDEPEETEEVAEDIKGWYWVDGTGTAQTFTIARDQFNPLIIFFGTTFGTTQRGQKAKIGDYFLRNASLGTDSDGEGQDMVYFDACHAPITEIGDSFLENTNIKTFNHFFDSNYGGISNLSAIGDNFLADCELFNNGGANVFGDTTNPVSVGHIGDFFMMNCIGYTADVNVWDAKSIGDYFMYFTGIQNASIGANTTHVGSNFLSWCEGLTSFNFDCSPTAFEAEPGFSPNGTLVVESLPDHIVKITSGYTELTDTPVDDFLARFPSFFFRVGEMETQAEYNRRLTHEEAVVYNIHSEVGGVVTEEVTVDGDFSESNNIYTEASDSSFFVSHTGGDKVSIKSIVVDGKTLKITDDSADTSADYYIMQMGNNVSIYIINHSHFCGNITVNVTLTPAP